MPRLLCLHGFTGAPAAWDEVLANLPEGWQSWCPDLLGHGPEPRGLPPGESTAGGFEAEVARLAQGLEARGWRRGVVAAGYSLGGRLALALLAARPELFARAVLVGAHPGLADEVERHARRQADEAWAHLLEEEGLEAFLERWQALPLFADQAELPAEVRARQRAWRLGHRASGLALSLRALGLGNMPSFWPLLPAIEVPVFLVVGERDDKFRQLAGRMAERLPRARLTVVPGAGHNVILSRPRAVAAALCEDLRP